MDSCQARIEGEGKFQVYKTSLLASIIKAEHIAYANAAVDFVNRDGSACVLDASCTGSSTRNADWTLPSSGSMLFSSCSP